MRFEKPEPIKEDNELPLKIRESETLKHQGRESAIWRVLAQTPEGQEKLLALKEIRREEFATDEEMRESKIFYDFLKSFPGFGDFVPDTLYFKARMDSGDKPHAYRLQRLIEGRRIDEVSDEEIYNDKELTGQLLNFVEASIAILKNTKEKSHAAPDLWGDKFRSIYLFDPRHSSNIIVAEKPDERGRRVFFVDTAPQAQQKGKIGKAFQQEIGTPLQIVQLERWRKILRSSLRRLRIATESTAEPRSREKSVAEREGSFKLDFYVTDHSADDEATGSPEKLRELYADIERDGVSSIRYDWRWTHIEPAPDQFSADHLDRYASAKRLMEETGLKPPTVILSNLPEWAKQLYKKDKEKFFKAYASYVTRVKQSLEAAGGEKISTIQILNELNNRVYTPVEAGDLPRLCQITREVFRKYNPDIKLMATLLASNTARFVGTPIEQYLHEFKKIKDEFDVIAVDYYPGLWHLAPKRPTSFSPSGLYKAMVKNVELLRAVFMEIATWGKEYELGEVGMRTNAPLGGSEKAQRYFYDAFFRAFKHLLMEFRKKGLRLPSRVGFYEAMDEPPKNAVGRLLRKFTPFPEHDMGMREANGERKAVLRAYGKIGLSKEESGRISQLKKIINYLRAPVGEKES